MEPEHDGLENDFPLQLDDFEVPCSSSRVYACIICGIIDTMNYALHDSFLYHCLQYCIEPEYEHLVKLHILIVSATLSVHVCVTHKLMGNWWVHGYQSFTRNTQGIPSWAGG